ncbi:alpha/beta hydrolase [Fodinicola acaciae]|uniref:alpha/beta hydrolase n=1 Tax=Fodinicola acaciae TaxID=2681555 RepID=UPI0013D26C11|nr:alpha/beta hydrolase [Fodinicola acaciae]
MRKIRRWGAVTAALVVTVASLVGSAPAHAAGTIDWGACPPEIASQPGGSALQCGSVSVPLDYTKPAGPHISVAVSRLAAPPEHRRGVLLLNPGGPGGPGLDMPLMIGQLAPASVLDSYDLIGFDPRGLGHSTAQTCALTTDQQMGLIPYPRAGGFDADVAFQKQVVKQCFDNSGAVLPYITTANTARDMDQIRTALGERKISYFGVSYGTYLGAVYSSLFPQNTDRVILDSSVGSQLIWRDEFRAWGPATELRFPDFAKWAAARNGAYELGATPAAVRATYFRLAAKLDKTPVGPYTGNVFRGQTRGGLYNDSQFASLAQLWQALDRADAATATAVAKRASLATPPADDGAAVLTGVLCGDTAWPKDLSRYQADRERDAKRYPISGAMASNVWPCAFWPVPPKEPLVKIDADGPSNILILQNLRDPATIYSGGVQMRASFGDRARLVTVNQGGHGVYLFTQNACSTNLATQWLVNGTLPRHDQYCSAGDVSLKSKAIGANRDRIVQQLQARQRPF